MVDLNEYLHNPCGVSSVPYWKTKTISIPSNMKILYQNDYCAADYNDYMDEPYFRLIHDLERLPVAVLPEGYSLCEVSLAELAAHIRSCYVSASVTEAQLLDYRNRPVFDTSLWIAVRHDLSGQIVASGIGELDRELGEGVLEWIQVSADHRRCGLGRFVVSELLRRMKDKADFVTVSGQCYNQTCPERLYRSCGFTGDHIWHILSKK